MVFVKASSSRCGTLSAMYNEAGHVNTQLIACLQVAGFVVNPQIPGQVFQQGILRPASSD